MSDAVSYPSCGCIILSSNSTPYGTEATSGNAAAVYFLGASTKAGKAGSGKEVQAASSLYMRLLRPARFSSLFGVARSGLFINITGSQGGENANRAINGGIRFDMPVPSSCCPPLSRCVCPPSCREKRHS